MTRCRVAAALRRAVSGLALLGSAAAGQERVAPTSAPELRAGKLIGAVRLGGRLDEVAWAAADSIAGLAEVEPKPGIAPAARTVVRILVSRDAIDIGVQAFDPDAEHLVAFAREGDAPLRAADHVKIRPDTHRDGRSGSVLAVNPNGARYDALVVDRGKDEDSNWNAIWQAATDRSALGWTAEIRIPARTLLSRKGLAAWRLNIERRVQRLQETSRWAAPSPDPKPTYTSRAGLLTDIPNFEHRAGRQCARILRTRRDLA